LPVIAAANLFTRNVYKEYLRRDASDREQAEVSKITSLAVKAGAVLFILGLQPQFSINLQLIAGWVAGMATGVAMLSVRRTCPRRPRRRSPRE
jgi:Na+/proline symporter